MEKCLKWITPAKLPPPTEIDYIEEPYVKATTIVPKDFVGTIMELSQDKRGEYQSMEYLDETRVSVVYHLPLSEIIYDYFDKLKSATKGYASLDYELIGYKQSPMVKMDILLMVILWMHCLLSYIRTVLLHVVVR